LWHKTDDVVKDYGCIFSECVPALDEGVPALQHLQRLEFEYENLTLIFFLLLHFVFPLSFYPFSVAYIGFCIVGLGSRMVQNFSPNSSRSYLLCSLSNILSEYSVVDLSQVGSKLKILRFIYFFFSLEKNQIGDSGAEKLSGVLQFLTCLKLLK